MVGFQHRPDQQHGRAGGAHQRGQQRADGQQPGIQRRRRAQRAPDQNAAGQCIQREQQDNERDVLGHQRMRQQRQGGGTTEGNGERQQEQHGPQGGDLAEMVMPDARRKDREQGNRQQDAAERQGPAQTQCGAIEVGSTRHAGQQEQKRQQVFQDRLHSVSSPAGTGHSDGSREIAGGKQAGNAKVGIKYAVEKSERTAPCSSEQDNAL